MKTKLLLVLVALLVVAAGCGNQSVPEATEEFCQSLVDYRESLANLGTITPTSTVKELEDAQKTEERPREDVVKAASNLREVKLDSIDQAWKTLDKTINQISNRDTLAEAAAQVEQAVAGVQAAYEQLGLDNCPDQFPAAAGLPEPSPDETGIPSQPVTGTQPLTATTPSTQTTTIPVTATIVSTPTAAMPAAPAKSAPTASSSPIGIVWQLQAIQSTSGTIMTPSDPTLYTLILQPDGTASVLADCISGMGPYSIAGTNISFAIQYNGTTCPSPSIASQYTKYLDYANSYTLEDGGLIIGYSNNAGQMTFAQAPE